MPHLYNGAVNEEMPNMAESPILKSVLVGNSEAESDASTTVDFVEIKQELAAEFDPDISIMETPIIKDEMKTETFDHDYHIVDRDDQGASSALSTPVPIVENELANTEAVQSPAAPPQLISHRQESPAAANGNEELPPPQLVTQNTDILDYLKLSSDSGKQLKCPQCSFTTPHKRLLDDHQCMLNNHTNPVSMVSSSKPYSCTQCSYKAKRRSTLKKHLETHKNGQIILSCSHCDYRSTNQAMIHHRMRCSRPENGVKCPICSLSSTNIYLLQQHIKGHKNEDSTETTAADQMAYYQRLMEIRKNKPIGTTTSTMKVNQNDEPPVIENMQETEDFLLDSTLSCSYCSFTTSKQMQLKEHIKVHRSNQAVIGCVYCAQKYTRQGLQTHMLNLHPGQKMILPQEMNKCYKCSYQTTQRGDLVKHERRHKIGERMIYCPYCDFRSNIRSVHHHQSKCKLRTNQRQEPTCKYRCGHQGTLLEIQTHEKTCSSRIFACSTCNYRAENADALKLHLIQCNSGDITSFILRDPNTNLYHCKHCSYRSDKMPAIKKHLRCHQRGDRIIQCPHCDYKSTQQALIVHTKILHKPVIEKMPNLGTPQSDNKNGMFSCPLCSYTTNNRVHLRRHLPVHDVEQSLSSTSHSTGSHELSCEKKPLGSLCCSYCGFKAKTIPLLRQHLRCHRSDNNDEMPQLECQVDEDAVKKFNRKIAVDDDEDDESVPMANECFMCTECTYVTKNENDMKEHVKCHETVVLKKESKQIQCTKCSFVARGDITPHMKVHKKGMRNLQCPKCDYQSPKNSFIDHIKKKCPPPIQFTLSSYIKTLDKKESDVIETPTIKRKKEEFSCDDCNFTTALRIQLNNHKKKFHSTEKYDPSTKEVKSNYCPICSYVPIYKTSLKTHIILHRRSNNRIYKCYNCPEKGTLTYFREHYKTCVNHAKKGEFKDSLLSCSKCSFVTYFSGDFLTHMDNCKMDTNRVITDVSRIKNYKCNYCSFTTYWPYAMERHKHEHEVLKLPVVKCSKCDFLSINSVLNTHQAACRGARRA